MTVARSILGYTTELSATMAAIAMITYKIIDCRFFLLSIPCPCVVSPQTRRQRALLGSCTAKDTQGTFRITALRKTLCSPPLGQVSRAIGVEQGREVVYLGADVGAGVGVGHEEGALVHLELVVV